jgi:hypothetical protein
MSVVDACLSRFSVWRSTWSESPIEAVVISPGRWVAVFEGVDRTADADDDGAAGVQDEGSGCLLQPDEPLI